MVGKGKMFVLKRDGRRENVHFDKITSRIQKLCYGLNMDYVDPICIALRIIDGLYSGVTTVELDNLAAETAATMITKHADYAILAARIAVSNLHKETKKVFSDVISDLYHVTKLRTKTRKPMISEKYYKLIQKHADELNSVIIYDRDFGYDYIGFKTMEKSYLLKIQDKVVERPQHMLMRVAVAIHGEDIEKVIETYNFMSERYFIHASSTLLSACTLKQQMASSFSLTMMEDSIKGIYDTTMRCELINKSRGDIGLNLHCIRGKGTGIGKGRGVSSGLIPMLRVYDELSGPISVYLEPWHSDIFEYLELKKRFGKDEFRTRELSCALWIPDLFMERTLEDGVWSLMCPHECPGLIDAYGDDFKILYTRYEKEKRYVRQISARELWFAILRTQYETGTPYILYKDHCNRKSNQQNVGTIKCGSFNTDVIQYSSSDEVASCNLASIAVNMFVNPATKIFDFGKLKEVTKLVTRNLNKIIDVNYYPLPEAKKSSQRHRPIGIGIQGLADAFLLMRFPFESEEAQKLNIQIFETLYYGALEASCELAEVEGAYSTYEGSPISKGILQYDMWKVAPTNLWDWGVLKGKIATHGVRNSLLIAQMSTTPCAQILGNNESVQPYTSNIDTRRVPSGEIHIVNPHLLKELSERDLWDEDMKNEIVACSGFIRNIKRIPEDMKSLYKTVWEIPQKIILKMAIDRGAFIDQSQSIMVHMAKPTPEKLTSMHFYGWKHGLKTGMFHLRIEPAAGSGQLNDDQTKSCISSTDKENEKTFNWPTKNLWLHKQQQVQFEKENNQKLEDAYICSRDNGDACMSCGS